jgi:hypothetical protein
MKAASEQNIAPKEQPSQADDLRYDAALFLIRQHLTFVSAKPANNRGVVRLLLSAGGQWNVGSRRDPLIIVLKFQT